jgi:predicted DNA-binding transcriptional regulator AlpA
MNQIFLFGIQLQELMNSIRNLIREEVSSLRPPPKEAPSNRVGGTALAKEVTGLAQSTIYNLVAKNAIPHSKQGKKLYFVEEELRVWVLSGRRKTVADVASEVDSFLSRHKRAKKKPN